MTTVTRNDENLGQMYENVQNQPSQDHSIEQIKTNFANWLQSPIGNSCKPHLVGRRLRIVDRLADFLLDADNIPLSTINLGTSPSLEDAMSDHQQVCSFLENERKNRGLGPSGLMDTGVFTRQFVQFLKLSQPSNIAISCKFSATEALLDRFIKACSHDKKKRAVGPNNLEELMLNNRWCELKELQKVIPYHMENYTAILKKCQSEVLFMPADDLSFAMAFMVTYCFLMIKGTRPASYANLTMAMLNNAKDNGGFVDQAKFKTDDVYLFDSLQMCEKDLNMLQQYVTHIRPLMNPQCDHVFINSRNGGPLKDVSRCFTKLVYEATGKTITPTIYRKIIETESDDKLDASDKETISEDQKHSSGTAKRYYRLRRARNAAKKGKKCMTKLVGKTANEVKNSIAKHLKLTKK